MNYDVIIVGGGIAGLTSASFLSKEGYKVLLCEKEKKLGGLVSSFEFKGFTFDGGIRAIENSGIVFPMLKQLGLDIDFIKNNVSIGIEKDIIKVISKDSLRDYQELLNVQFPDNIKDITAIIGEIARIMEYMDILYGIDNPIFLDLKKDKEYLFKTILPWLFKYLLTINKILKLNTPVEEYLKKFSKNQALIDIIAQHFFKKTPAFFALSYFSLYLDYQYPMGGTGALIGKMEEFILKNNCEIKLGTEICSINPQTKQVVDIRGNIFEYKKLIWTSDLKKLYSSIDLNSLKNNETKKKIIAKKTAMSDKIGGDSILTTYVTLDIDKSYFEKIGGAHFFYTPVKKGLSNISLNDLMIQKSSSKATEYTTDKQAIIDWVKQYYDLTTYEISCPAIRDASLAPEGKTGLIISTLMEYSLVKHISKMGWYDEFKVISQERILTVLDSTVFPGISAKVMDKFTSTPLTLQKLTGNSDGAITGWAFTNSFIPATSKLPKIAQSVITPIPDVFQAGQWTFSPSGFPISILTAKLASDKAIKQLALKK